MRPVPRTALRASNALPILGPVREERPYRFPGMDPWLEDPSHWAGVHHALISAIASDLNRQLVPAYVARFGVRIVVEDREEPYIEIRIAGPEGKVITVIEVLSPGNKRPGTDASEKYRQKQREVLASDVSLVEIDLLRGGRHVAFVPPERLVRFRPYDYLVAIRRAHRPSRGEVYPIRLRDRLPRVPVPLQKGEADAALDLQELIERVYRDGAFWMTIHYDGPCDPPLLAYDARWGRGLAKHPRAAAPAKRRPRKR